MRAIALIASGILILVGLVALAAWASGGGWVAISIAVASAVGVAAFYLLDRDRAARERENRNDSDERRLRELFALAKSGAATLSVTGRSGIGLGLLATVLAGAGLHFGLREGDLIMLGVCAFFFVMGLLVLADGLRYRGHPRIELSARGIVTPISGQIPWQSIDGIYLEQYALRGAEFRRLLLRIPDLSRLIWAFSLAQRFIYCFRFGKGKAQFAIPLNGNSESPRFTYTVARMLWYEATGRNFDWNPGFGDALNALNRDNVTVNPDVEWWVAVLREGWGVMRWSKPPAMAGSSGGNAASVLPGTTGSALQKIEELNRELMDFKARNATPEEYRAHLTKSTKILGEIDGKMQAEGDRFDARWLEIEREMKMRKRKLNLMFAALVAFSILLAVLKYWR